MWLRSKLAKTRRDLGDVGTEFLLRGIRVVVKRKEERERLGRGRKGGRKTEGGRENFFGEDFAKVSM